jgi:hypothetical protein
MPGVGPDIDLPDEAGSIVLYDWMSDDVKEGRNLMRVRAIQAYADTYYQTA